MSTINAVINKVHGCAKLILNGTTISFGSTYTYTAGNILEVKNKKGKHHKVEISVTNQDPTNTLTLTYNGAVVSILAGTSATLEFCSCKRYYTIGIVVV